MKVFSGIKFLERKCKNLSLKEVCAGMRNLSNQSSSNKFLSRNYLLALQSQSVSLDLTDAILVQQLRSLSHWSISQAVLDLLNSASCITHGYLIIELC